MQRWEKMCKQYADENELPYEDIREIYKLFFEYLRDTIREYDIYADYTREEINEKFPKFHIPGIGSFYFDYIRYLRNRKEHKIGNGEVQDEDDSRGE
jgi:hypothetical protein